MTTRILGIESSCDETAAAVVADGREILSNVVASQVDLHCKYGGVVPELASREHFFNIAGSARRAMMQPAKLTTRWRSFWAWVIPADRFWTAWRLRQRESARR